MQSADNRLKTAEMGSIAGSDNGEGIEVLNEPH